MAAKTRAVGLTREEVHVLYALAGRDVSGCVLDGIGGGIAGSHAGHKDAVLSALMKLGDVVLGWAEKPEERR